MTCVCSDFSLLFFPAAQMFKRRGNVVRCYAYLPVLIQAVVVFEIFNSPDNPNAER